MTDIHSARSYLVESVIPAYESLVTQLQDGQFGRKRDLQAAGMAAERCLHLADFICRDTSCNSGITGAPRSKQYVAALTDQYFWFRIARDMANVHKHRTVSRTDGPALRSLDDVEEAIVLVKHEDDAGHYYIAEKVVFVRLLDGDVYLAEDVIRGCIAEWAKELQGRGVVPDQPFALVRKWKADRADFPEGPTMKLLLDEGVPVDFQPVVRVYDAASEKPRRRRLDEPFHTHLAVDWEVRPDRFTSPAQAKAQTGHYTLQVSYPAGVLDPPEGRLQR